MYTVAAVLSFVTFAFCAQSYVTAAPTENDVEGYYWRDYTGSIPFDAVPGGKDENGETTYIGQTVHNSAILVPGKISATQKKMFYEFGRVEYSGNEDVKILCSQHPEQLEWIPTNTNEILRGLKDKHLIVGGYEIGYRVLIGRVTSHGQVLIGKVHTIDNEFTGIHVTGDGKGWQESNFEVLSYNPDIHSTKSTNIIHAAEKPTETSKTMKERLSSPNTVSVRTLNNSLTLIAILLLLCNGVIKVDFI